MKFYDIKEFADTGLAKALYIGKEKNVRWRIYSLNPEFVDLKNYEELAKYCNVTTSDLVRIPQKHTTNIRIVTRDMAGEGVVRMESPTCFDGIVTNEKNIVLCTIEADCTPVYILDKKNKAIGMVHSGWRGAVGKISVNAILTMKENYGTNTDDVMIYFGPSICKNCYEVGEDPIEPYRKAFGDRYIEFFKKIDGKSGKYFLDVTGSIEKSLLDIGIKKENIFRSPYCTYHDEGFDSWRRDGKGCGHILSAIMLI